MTLHQEVRHQTNQPPVVIPEWGEAFIRGNEPVQPSPGYSGDDPLPETPASPTTPSTPSNPA